LSKNSYTPKQVKESFFRRQDWYLTQCVLSDTITENQKGRGTKWLIYHWRFR